MQTRYDGKLLSVQFQRVGRKKRERLNYMLGGMLLVIGAVVSHTVLATDTGETEPEVWVDGPADVKLGGDPRTPDAAVDFRGRKIFVWSESMGISSQEIALRIFDEENSSLVDPVQVNTLTLNTQDLPRVAVQADGSFLVIWQSAEPPNPEDNFERKLVRSRAYNADGSTNGGEQLFSTLQSLQAGDISADVAALTGGGYVVVWQSSQSNGTDSGISIQGRLVNADGTPNGSQFQVNSTLSEREEDCSVTGMTDGGFFVAWSRPEIHGRRFQANATPVGDDIQVSTLALNVLRDETKVATADDGRMMVVWTDVDELENSTEIRGRILSSTASPLGSDFRINSLITETQDWPGVGGFGNNFFVVWASDTSTGDDIEPSSIEGRIVSQVNQFVTPQFQVNQWTEDTQSFPGISGYQGRIAVGWRSQSNPDSTQNVIQGLGWKICGIFCDGFE